MRTMPMRNGNSLQPSRQETFNTSATPSGLGAAPECSGDDGESEGDEFVDGLADVLWMLGLVALFAIPLAILTLLELMSAVRLLFDH